MTTTVRRSFSGFLTHEGKIETNLAASVPTVANWLLSELPQFSPWRHHITNPHRRAPTVPECLDEFFQRGNESDDRSNQPAKALIHNVISIIVIFFFVVRWPSLTNSTQPPLRRLGQSDETGCPNWEAFQKGQGHDPLHAPQARGVLAIGFALIAAD